MNLSMVKLNINIQFTSNCQFQKPFKH